MIYGNRISNDEMLGEIRGLLDLFKKRWKDGDEKERYYLLCRHQVQMESQARRLAGYTFEQWEYTGPWDGPYIPNAGCDHDHAWSLWKKKIEELQPRIDAMMEEYES